MNSPLNPSVNTSPPLSYKDAIERARLIENLEKLLLDSYLDKNPSDAWERFGNSEEFAEVIKLLTLDKGKYSIIDIGCGNGIATINFAKYGHKVFALDPNEDEITGLGAILNSQNDIVLLKSGVEEIPLEDSSIERAYARQALHHFLDLKSGIKEIHRVLKPGGLLLASREHVIDSIEEREAFLAGHALHKFYQGEWAYFLGEYLSAFQEAGFILIKKFAPFDSVINHYPISSVEVLKWFSDGLKRRFGDKLGLLLSKSDLLLNLYRRKLSRDCKVPGSMWSFLLRK